MQVTVSTKEQLEIVLEIKPARVYVELGVCCGGDKGDRFATERFVTLPHIMREETGTDEEDMRWVFEESAACGYRGVLARNLEQVGYLVQNGYQGEIVTDASLYVWNNGSVSFLNEVCGDALAGVTLPYELSYQELQEIRADVPRTMVVYGRIPMMVSANCVKRTTAACLRSSERSAATSIVMNEKESEQSAMTITDRMQHDFPVMLNCRYCYNVILNTVPLSLHKQLPLMVRDAMAEAFRVDLTTETAQESEQILTYFKKQIRRARFDKGKAKIQTPPYEAYTTGNYRRSAE